jgi:hypothetical protein
MNKKIPLTKPQKEIMKEFYQLPPTKVIFDKKERNKLWNLVKKRKIIPSTYQLEIKCPALKNEIERSYTSKHLVQSAVFSECVYAQTLANMFQLNLFNDCRISTAHIPEKVLILLNSYSLVPRYSYSSNDYKKMLIQAGGHGGVDSALIIVEDLNIYTIEFKEPAAKSSEPDLPKYGEDGKFVTNEQFNKKYPQFYDMLEQYLDKSIFDYMGSNINNFSFESINKAVSNNYSYSNKYAHVCCTEDEDGYLTMIPINQIQLWAEIVGEIRPAGRNSYKVWTPIKLKEFIKKLEGKIENNIVTIPLKNLKTSKARGGNNSISRYKINPLFFVYKKDTKIIGDKLQFNFNKIRQLKPTITAKIFFKKFKYYDVKKHYGF